MELKEFAKKIDGKEYGYQIFSDEEIQIAKDNGFIIVYGMSDDLMEFEGVMRDEGGCFDGGEVYFNRDLVRHCGIKEKTKKGTLLHGHMKLSSHMKPS